MSLHKNLPYAEIHTPFSFFYNNAAERLAATGFTAADGYKVAIQQSDRSLWALANHSPIVWESLGGSAGTTLSDIVPISVSKSSALAGTSLEVSRQDHKHSIDTAAPTIGIGSGNNEGSATSLSRSDHNHTIRETSGPTNLTMGAIPDGYVFTRSGSTIVGSTAAILTNIAPLNVNKSAASVGVETTAARSDHKHDINTAAPSIGVGASNSEGSSTSVSRADHNHTIRETGGPTDLTMGSVPDGNFLMRSGTNIIGAASVFDQRDIVMFDHFITSNATSISFGNYNWRKSGTGTGNDLIQSGEAGHPGIARILGGTGAAARSAISVGDGFETIIAGGTNAIEFEALVSPRTSVASANLLQFLLGAGLGWNTTGSNPLTDGIYWRFTAASDTNLVGVCRASSTETTRVSSTVPTVNSWYRIGFIWTPGGTPSVQFKLNGANVGAAITTNIPSILISPGFRVTGNGGVLNPEIAVDYVLIKQITDKET